MLGAIEAATGLPKFRVFGLIGPAGSGKSTVLMRLALTLRQQGRDVFFSEGTERPHTAAVVNALRRMGRQAIVCVDNAHLLGPVIYELVDAMGTVEVPPLLVFAARMNLVERRLRAIERQTTTRLFELHDLSAREITGLLGVLERYAQLGHLAAMSHQERLDAFRIRAKKQILVAMREATRGYGFDEIVRGEFQEIDNPEVRVLFLCAAVATAELIDIDRKQLLACAECSPAEALTAIRRNLRGLLFEDEKGRVFARHPVIAELIVDVLASRADVAEAYVRLLNTLAHDIGPGRGRSSRAWRLFVRLIDHRRIFSRFTKDIELARSIYRAVDRHFQGDGHFWLQFANLEIEFGEVVNARPHVAYAEALMPEHPFVMTTKAHLALRESRDVESVEEAWALRNEAETVLREQIGRAGATDEYPYHVYLSGMLRWVERWSHGAAGKRRELEELRTLAEEATRRHAYSKKIKDVASSVEREYLMTVVVGLPSRPGGE